MTGPRGPQGEGFPGAKVRDLNVSFKMFIDIYLSAV